MCGRGSTFPGLGGLRENVLCRGWVWGLMDAVHGLFLLILPKNQTTLFFNKDDYTNLLKIWSGKMRVSKQKNIT